MLMKCDVCGCEFDSENAGSCDCGFGCGGAMVKCPECGFHVDLPIEIRDQKAKEYEEKTIFSRLQKSLDKNSDIE